MSVCVCEGKTLVKHRSLRDCLFVERQIVNCLGHLQIQQFFHYFSAMRGSKSSYLKDDLTHVEDQCGLKRVCKL